MRIYGLEDLPCKHKSHIVTIGGFDGVHIGHQAIIKEMLYFSKETGFSTVVITFKVPPKFILEKRKPELLTTVEEKLWILKSFGIEEVLLLNFDLSLKNITASQFLERVIINGLNAHWIVIGFNHTFGHGKKGNARFLATRVKKYDFGLTVIPPLKRGRYIASSTRIRSLLKRGKLEEVNMLLGRPYFAIGKRVKGKGTGKKIGIPTYNLEFPSEKLLPPHGVYAVKFECCGKLYYGAANLGFAPTLSKKERPTLEIHVLNYDSSLDKVSSLRVEFIKFLRPEKKFKSSKELVLAIKQDIEKVKYIFQPQKVGVRV